jgi:hypothetical protein
MQPTSFDPKNGSGVIAAGHEVLDRAKEVSRRIVERVRQVSEDTATDPGDDPQPPPEEVVKSELSGW